MSKRSLKVAPQYIQRVKDSFNRSSFPSHLALATEAGFSRDTVRKFLNGRQIDRLNFIELCEKLGLDWQEIADKPSVADNDPDFVGREAAMITLNELSRGAKVILIQGAGGVGKTTLARKYLTDKFGDKVIEFPIAKETANIAPVEGLLEQCLLSLGEEPGRDFLVSLTRLKQKLQAQPMGILIDNLEPALDKTGRFVEPHRRYLELLRILTNSSVKSVTLITSRYALGEGGDISHYRLPSLALAAWQTYFNNQGITGNNQSIQPLWADYQGNALAMKLLCDRILLDQGGNVAAFWQRHQKLGTLLTVENLIKEQFDRLEKVHPDAYRLLCRMGCYRYQDVPTVPLEGLFCLLWDVAENRRGRTVSDLCDRSLVDCINGEHQLHPLIREEAINRLNSSDDWKQANLEAVNFWTKRAHKSKTIENWIEFLLQVYYHCEDIDNYELATNIAIKEINNQFVTDEMLGTILHRSDIFYRIITVIKVAIFKVSQEHNKAKLYIFLGELYWLTSKLTQAIDAYTQSKIIGEKYNDQNIQIHSCFNIGVCFIHLGENKLAEENFNHIRSITSESNVQNYLHHQVNFCMAFLYSCMKCEKDTRKYIADFYITLQVAQYTLWDKGYSYLFIALAHKNLGETDQAIEQNQAAIEFANENHYIQVKAKALTGLAELYRIQKDYNTALDHHHQSIAILEKIGAKCDLAEAHYQLALTYQAINDTENSQTQFNQAIKLWTEIDAPKQIEKVQNAMRTHSPD